MTTKLKPYQIASFGIPILLLLFLIFLSKTAVFKSFPQDLSIGIILDLIITVPLVYWFLIRKTSIPKITTIYVLFIGLLIGTWVIPQEQQVFLSQIKYVLIPLIELSLLSLFIYKIISINKAFKKNQQIKADFYDTLQKATSEIFPGRVGKVFATEIAVFY